MSLSAHSGRSFSLRPHLLCCGFMGNILYLRSE